MVPLSSIGNLLQGLEPEVTGHMYQASSCFQAADTNFAADVEMLPPSHLEHPMEGPEMTPPLPEGCTASLQCLKAETHATHD